MNMRYGLIINTKQIVILFILILVFEGAIRKWVVPGATNILIGIRDFCAITLIFQAIKSRAFRQLGNVFDVALLWSGLVIIWGLMQLIILQTSPVIFLFGLRFWLLYLWMALAVGVLISKDELFYIFNLIKKILFLMTPLVLVQYFSPPDSMVNSQPDTEVADIFRVSGDIVRASGTFSFTLGYTCFLALLTPLVLQSEEYCATTKSWITSKLVFSILLIISTLLSGSRAAIIFYVGVFVCSVVLQIFKKSNIESAVFSSVKILAWTLMVVALLLFFEGAVYAIFDRFESASDSEVFSDRILTIFLGEPEVRQSVTFLGAGLGAGTNVGGLVSTGDRFFQLAESEPGRITLEGGFIGYLYTLLKIFLVTAGVLSSISIMNSSGRILPVLMWICAGLALLSWPISGQLSAHGFSFLMLGLSFAALRHGAS